VVSIDCLRFPLALLDIYFFIFKEPCPFEFKEKFFSFLIHFFVACSVNVVATTNYVSHNGNHTGSVAPQAATVVVVSCGVLLPIVFLIYFQATSQL
jgi:hypothetical protein